MQLPSNILHKAFSEIDVNEKEGKLEIFFSTMVGLSGEMSEGWKTGIAIDASVSMTDAFGRGLKGAVPEDIKKTYQKKGWIQKRKHDGMTVQYWNANAYKDAIKQGYLNESQNIVEPEAKKFSSYLADNLDEDGGTDIIYWACGNDGKNIDELGKLDSQTCMKTEFNGPKNYTLGQATYLLPAVQYFEKKYHSAKRGLFIFITDGKLDDLDRLKDFTINLAKEIKGNKRNLFKAVLIGIGDEIDEKQMIQLDDLDTGTDVDIWDHKIIEGNMIIGPTGTIYDSAGKAVKKYNDGVPAKGCFDLPLNSTFFTFDVGGQTIKQTIRTP